ncbi:MAG: hypothetical protein CMJ40_04245 [Phycisphaerae bacterium]|nr:hypothetical protein [Phycisphaerae bacterium]
MTSSPKIILTCLIAALVLQGCDDTPSIPKPDPVEEATALPGQPTRPTLPTPGTSRIQSSREAASKPAEDSPTPPTDPSRAEFAGLRGPIPATWKWEPPRHHFRAAQWVVPGRDGGEPAELVVTTFPEASGNTIQNNIERWKQQFRSTQGGPPQPVVESKVVNGLSVTLVDLEGEYLGMGGGFHKVDYRMIVSIVETVDRSVFIKLLGPESTVAANRNGYMDLIDNLNVMAMRSN